MKVFQSTLLLLVFGLMTPALLHGQLLMEENFNTPTTDISTQTGWTSLAAGAVGSTVAPPYIVVRENSSLVYPGYIASGVGNSAYMNGAGQDAQLAMTSSVTGGTLYLSFMLKVDTASVTGDFFWLVRNTSNHNRWRMWIKRATDTTFVLGIGKGSSVQKYDSVAYKLGQTHLVVAKYDFATATTTDAKLSMWVDPPMNSFGLTEPTPNISNFTDAATADFATINRFALIMNGIGNAPTLSIAGIRLGTDWKTAVPAPPLYYNGTTAIDDPASWGTNIDGSGNHPADFGADNQLYLMRTPSTVSVTGFWLIGGVGSRLVIGGGSTVTIGPGGFLNATVDVSTGGKLVLTGGDWPTIGSNAGIVSFDNPAGITLMENKVLPSSAGTYDLTRGTLALGGFNLTVKGRFRTLGNTVAGTGTFTVDSAGSLLISSPDGITKTADSGDIRSTGRLFSKYGNYTYMGTADQVTGNGLPDTVANLSIAMSSKTLTTSLSKPVFVTSNLNFNAGKYRLRKFNLTFNNPAGQSDSSYVITDSTGALVRVVSNANVKTMPVGSADELRVARFKFESSPTSARLISFRYVTGDTGSVGFPVNIYYRYTGGYWTVASDSATNPTYELHLIAPFGFATPETRRLIYRADASSAWDTVGTVPAFNEDTVSQAGVDRFGQFALGVGAPLPPSNGKRYESEVFSSYQVQAGIVYGTDPKQTLDLYSGSGETQPMRPLVIFIPGGGFKAVNAPGQFSRILAGGLAKRGYAVANVTYYRTTTDQPTDSASFEIMLKAQQDIKAAIRFLRMNGMSYGIDTSQIFLTGSSAGSITALHVAFLDSAEVPHQYVNWANLGGTFDGPDRGTPGVSSRISGVIANWGAIGDTSWMRNNRIPVYCVHGDSDKTVFYNSIPSDGPFAYSSKYIHEMAQRMSLPGGLLVFTNTGHTLDSDAPKQTEAYVAAATWLRTILDPGTTNVEEAETAIPTSFDLLQNYPNPFNPATTIRFQLPIASDVSLTVVNLLGQTVATLAEGPHRAGEHAVVFDASRLATGLYFYRLRAGDFVRTHKMLLVK